MSKVITEVLVGSRLHGLNNEQSDDGTPTSALPDKNSELKKHFEANMLDGDDVNDCGGAMLSAKYVLEYLQEYMPEFTAKAELDLLTRLEAETTTIDMRADGENPWSVIPLTTLQSERALIEKRMM